MTLTGHEGNRANNIRKLGRRFLNLCRHDHNYGVELIHLKSVAFSFHLLLVLNVFIMCVTLYSLPASFNNLKLLLVSQGTKMVLDGITGIKKPKDRQDIIAYLKATCSP